MSEGREAAALQAELESLQERLFQSQQDAQLNFFMSSRPTQAEVHKCSATVLSNSALGFEETRAKLQACAEPWHALQAKNESLSNALQARVEACQHRAQQAATANPAASEATQMKTFIDILKPCLEKEMKESGSGAKASGGAGGGWKLW